MLLSTLLLQAAATTALAKIGGTLGAALVVIGAAWGIGRIGTAAMEAIARQPEAANDVRSTMIIVAALIEGAALLAIIVCVLAVLL